MRTLSKFLPASSQLLAHTKLLRRLQAELEALLPRDLIEHCRIRNLRDTTLCLETDAPVWANRLRYLLPSLEQRLRQRRELQHLTAIELSVVPHHHAAPKTKRQARLSSTAAQVIHDSAEVTSDPALQAALRRLAGRGSFRP